jgi:hypothetical protein
MPFVAVPDKNSGDVFTTAMWSTFLEGNLNAGVNRPIYDSGPLASTQAAIDILSIPATFAQLMLFIHGRGDTAASSVLAALRFNNDSGANYYFQRLFASAAASTAAESLAQTSMGVGALPAATAVTGFGGGIVVAIPGYSGSSFTKGAIALNAAPLGTTTGTIVTEQRAGVWNSSVAINRITLLAGAGNFAVGSRVVLYGLGGLV